MDPHPTATHRRYQRLLEAAQTLPPLPTAVAHPCDRISLESVVEAAKFRLIEPILVGPAARIRDTAAAAQLDISAYALVPAEHSQDSAAKAVELIRQGKDLLHWR